MSLKLYESSDIQNIADAIKAKTGSANKMKVRDMAEAINSITTGGDPDPRCVNGMLSPQAAPDGSWIKPDEWPDLEALPLSPHEAYFLCDRDLGLKAFCARVYFTGELTFERGHIENGAFVSDAKYSGAFSSGNYAATIFDDSMPKYIVIHFEATKTLTSCYMNAMNTTTILNTTRFIDNALPIANNTTYTSSSYYPILWRVANLPNGTSLACVSYYLQKDYVTNFHTAVTTSFSLASAYANDYNLVEIHVDGKLASYVTSCASTFSSCFYLSKIYIEDFDSIVCSKTTSTASMFANCYCLREIDASNWDMSAVNTITSMFSAARSLMKIKGVENWDLNKCLTMDTTFANTWNLFQDNGTLDLSKWFRNKTVAITKIASMFSHVRTIKKIIIDGFDLTSVISIGDMFSNCYALEEIQADIIGPGTSCTSAANLFNTCYSLKKVAITPLNLSKCTSVASMLYYNYAMKEFDVSKFTFPTVGAGFDSMARYCYALEKADYSSVNLGVANAAHTNIFGNTPLLRELYPPTNIGRTMTFSGCVFLDHDSLIRILNNLSTVSTATTLTLGAINLNKLTDTEKAIAISKGWTLA